MTYLTRLPRRRTRVLLFLALPLVWPPATALAQTSSHLTKNLLNRKMRTYCRVATDYRCPAPITARVGTSCRCFLQEAGRYTRFGRIVRESVWMRDHR